MSVNKIVPHGNGCRPVSPAWIVSFEDVNRRYELGRNVRSMLEVKKVPYVTSLELYMREEITPGRCGPPCSKRDPRPDNIGDILHNPGSDQGDR